jgi:hypothetical protein
MVGSVDSIFDSKSCSEFLFGLGVNKNCSILSRIKVLEESVVIPHGFDNKNRSLS